MSISGSFNVVAYVPAITPRRSLHSINAEQIFLSLTLERSRLSFTFTTRGEAFTRLAQLIVLSLTVIVYCEPPAVARITLRKEGVF